MMSQLDKIIGKIFEVNRISFFDDELPVEAHLKEGMIQALIDYK